MEKSQDKKPDSPTSTSKSTLPESVPLQTIDKTVPKRGVDSARPLAVSNDRETLYASGTCSCKLRIYFSRLSTKLILPSKILLLLLLWVSRTSLKCLPEMDGVCTISLLGIDRNLVKSTFSSVIFIHSVLWLVLRCNYSKQGCKVGNISIACTLLLIKCSAKWTSLNSVFVLFAFTHDCWLAWS